MVNTACAVPPAARAVSPSVRPMGLPLGCAVLYLLMSFFSTFDLLKNQIARQKRTLSA